MQVFLCEWLHHNEVLFDFSFDEFVFDVGVAIGGAHVLTGWS